MRTGAHSIRLFWLAAVSLTVLTCGHGDTTQPPGVHSQSGADVRIDTSKGDRVLKHSDVAAMYDASPEVCRAFSVSIIGWGGRPRDEADVEGFRKETIEPLHRMAVRHVGSVGMVTEFGLFMEQCPEWEEAICLTPRGERLRVPWLWDHSHEGDPAYWFCTNDPRYRKFLRDQVVLAARGGVDGVHIDDHLGASATSWLEGCYCDSCIEGFKGYLRDHIPPERVREAGIHDVGTLNYRDVVRRWLDAHPGQHASEAPLGSEYSVYQFRAAEALMAELRELAERTAGRSLMFGANAGIPDTAQMTDYRVLTQFTAEVGQDAPSGLDDANVNAVVAYKIAAALDRPLLATASGQDWAFIKDRERPELVRAWVAQAYAFGQFFMAPHHQWCYTEQLGTHWYDGPREEYGPIYRFIREHPFLLDDQESAAEVAVLYSTGAARRGDETARDVVRELLRTQVPFDMLLAGDDWVPARLTWKEAGTYRKVIVPPDLSLDAQQQEVIDRLGQEGRLVVWRGADTLALLPASWIQTTGAAHVWAVLRRGPAGDGTVCHLLNRNYDASIDQVRPVGPLTMAGSMGPCSGKRCTAMLYAPEAEPRPLEVSQRDGSISVEVPSLSLWAVVRLRPEAASLPE